MQPVGQRCWTLYHDPLQNQCPNCHAGFDLPSNVLDNPDAKSRCSRCLHRFFLNQHIYQPEAHLDERCDEYIDPLLLPPSYAATSPEHALPPIVAQIPCKPPIGFLPHSPALASEPVANSAKTQSDSQATDTTRVNKPQSFAKDPSHQQPQTTAIELPGIEQWINNPELINQ